jgi:hypothetical protein
MWARSRGPTIRTKIATSPADAGTPYDFEVVGSASKVFDLERLEVEGLPVGVSPSVHRESKTG